MGVVNITPDSFYGESRCRNPWEAIKCAEKLLAGGASILDIGAASSRPGAPLTDPTEEQKRLLPALRAIRAQFPGVIISVDTYHSSTARASVGAGADMINDISAGSIDENMFATIASLQVPYVIMHMRGRPDTMQDNPVYGDVVREIAFFFAQKIEVLRQFGVHDIVIDPGFGFGKTLEQNYALLSGLEYFTMFDIPLMVGVSRKSMINKVLHTHPGAALNGTTVANTLALANGADILRVHDAREATEAIKITEKYLNFFRSKMHPEEETHGSHQ